MVDRNKASLLAAARLQLEEHGIAEFTMEALARRSGLTRQTVHNLFGSKSSLIEALFEHIARESSLQRMPQVMRASERTSMVLEFVKVFTDFWTSHRVLIRRIHAIAVLDDELAGAVEARNRRRKRAAQKVIQRLANGKSEPEMAQNARLLYALTSFEFFDTLLGDETTGEPDRPGDYIFELVRKLIL